MRMRYSRLLIIGVLSVAAALLAGCKDDVVSAGSAVLETEDSIIVRADTFRLSSSLVRGTAITATPDSFLLGEMDSKYGHLHADILTQFACPEGFVYPEGAVLDSVCLFLYYRHAYGDKRSPLAVQVYAMDRATFSYNEPLPSDTAIATYCSLDDSTRMIDHAYVTTALAYADSTYSSSYGSYIPTITLKLNDRWAQKVFAANDFSSQEAYNELMKGVYITTEFGGGTLLSLIDINMGVFYHFEYERAGVETVVEKDMKGFYASREVRQLNRYLWQASDLTSLEQNTDTNYVISPVHIYTQLSFPMTDMKTAITNAVGSRRPYVNRAHLTLPVLNYYDGLESNKTRDDWAQPASTMLLIRKSDMERFFNEQMELSDSIAMYAVLQSETDTLDVTTYSYEFDLSVLLTKQLREDRFGTLDMLLVPVSITTSTTSSGSTYISDIRYDQSLTATEIFSAQHPEHNLELEVVYSGF